MRRWVKAGACFVLAVGLVVLLGGWLAGIEALSSVIPGAVQMKPLTAVALAASGTSMLMLIDPGSRGRRRILGKVGALVALGTGLAVTAEYVLGLRLGIDELPFRDEVARAGGSANPGRPAPTSALSFLLVGIALLALDARPGSQWRPAELLAIPVTSVAIASMIGYLYGIPAFYGPASATNMAVHTAACFVALGGALIVARPHGHLLNLATTRSPGGIMARRLVPFVVLMPLTLGWARLQGGDAGLFSVHVGTWWLTAATIVTFLLMLGRVATRMNRLDVARRELEGELFQLANHDQLTGLFNRHRFVDELTQHARRTRRTGGSTALIVLDLDHLKEVNDAQGHVAGDALIRGVGKAIGQRARTTDTSARLGGDEFAVLLPAGTVEGAESAAEDLLRAIRLVLPSVVGVTGSSAASVGVAFTSAPIDDDGQQLLAEADVAMYEAKRGGGDRVAFFEKKVTEASSGSLSHAVSVAVR